MTQQIDSQSIENHLLGHGVEFAGYVNKQGRIVDYACKNEINLSQEQKDMFFMATTPSLRMQGDYDDHFGAVKYIVTERENSKIVSIPITSGAIVLVVNKDTNLRMLVKKILKKIETTKKLKGDLQGPHIWTSIV
ncbi:MAG TPA: DUF6659 family protein [Candidatus Bathyarchaeia archaeon]|nr:DUF6659 family protein [Candidatus Bathyarchaeia archaeon]